MTMSGTAPQEAEDSLGQGQTSRRWGIAGYCPVTLIEKSQWLKGDPRWGAVHRGHTYLFTSAAAQKEFLANPDRFSPAMSGIDPVQFTEQGTRVQGSLNYGIVYHDRMYFFADEPSLNRFYATPDRYAGYMQQAMQSFDRQHVRR
jgi:protein disulfide-isomerase